MDLSNGLTKVKEKRWMGLPLYVKWRNDRSLLRSFIGGLYQELVTFKNYGEATRQGNLVGIPIWGRRIGGNRISWHLGKGLTVRTVDILKKLNASFNQIFAAVDVKQVNGRKNVFVFWANSGEIAVLLRFFMRDVLKQKGLSGKDDLVFLCTKKYHKDMAEFLFPGIPAVVGKPHYLRYLSENGETKDWRISTFFLGSYFAEFEANAHRGNPDCHFFSWMQRYLKIESPMPPIPDDPALLEQAEARARRKLGDQYELDRTAIVLPDSFSMGRLSEKTLEKILKKCSAEGLQVFINSNDPSKWLSVVELYAIARNARKLYAVRSGLLDFLITTKVPMSVIYKNFSDRGFNTPSCDASLVQKIFTLKRLRAAETIELFDEK